MNNIFKFGLALLAGCVSASMFTSCDDWTEPESIDLVYKTPDQANPAEYAKYLEHLRNYRETNHTLTYVWFNNPTGDKVTNTRAERVSALPDSVDYVVFANPGVITEQTLADMKKVRQEKGMKFSYVIDFDAIKIAHITHQSLGTEENPYEVDFLDFVTDTLTTTLAYAKKNGFDGIMMAYNGKITNHMTPAELVEYKTQENVFIGVMDDWRLRNPDMTIDFLGMPQNVANKELINACHALFLSQTLSAKSAYSYEMAVVMASVDGVPTDRFGAAAPCTDPNNPKIGYMADGTPCVTALADWAAGGKVKAVGFTGAVNDYYNSGRPYPLIREAIQTINPCNL